MRSTLVAWIAGAVLGTSLPAFAHHSTANFDMTKTTSLSGTVTYFAFTNPHSYFDMDVTDPKGNVRHYKIFTVAKVVMTRNGWTLGDLKAGDHVTVQGNPDRKQPDYLYLQKITFASGKEWDRQRVF
jgi:Family of unknown function (DUF6152)